MTEKQQGSSPDDDAPESQVDEASEESFPASDPPAWTPSHAGPSAAPGTRRTGDAAREEPPSGAADPTER